MKTIWFSSLAQSDAGKAEAQVDPVDDPAQLGNPSDPPARASLAPAVVVENAVNADQYVANGVAQIDMVGPEHIIGLEPGQIMGRYPIPGSTGAEAVNLAAVEFNSTDLPWRFCPAHGGDAQRLRPWLVLVVVPASIGIVGGTPLPTMTVPVRYLPDLAESWAWAHVQFDDDNDTAGRSRLLCPLKLPARTALQAAIVPAFEGGRQAGLGQKVDPAAAHAPAWRPDQAEDVVLPVYDYWQFSTGADEDFEFLARRITPAPEEQLGSFGYRSIDIGNAWLDGTSAPATPELVALSGALRPFGTSPPSLTADQATAFAQAIADEIAATKDGDLGPPLRGGRHAMRPSINSDLAKGDWLDEANRDPQWRMVAARGADWVNANQEQLMADAWKQAGQIREAARRLAMSRAAVAITEAMHSRHVAALTTDELLTLVAPAAPRARLTGSVDEPTLHAALTATAAPAGTTTTAMARLIRPAAAIGRVTKAQTLQTRAIAGVLTQAAGTGAFGANLVAAANQTPPTDPNATLDPTTQEQTATNINTTAVAATALWVCSRTAQTQNVKLATEFGSQNLAAGPRVYAAKIQLFDVRVKAATTITNNLMQSVSDLSVTTSTPVVALHPDGLQISPLATDDIIRRAFDSVEAVRLRLTSNIIRDDQPLPSLDPVLPTPDVPAPLSTALLDRDPEWLLPGIGKFPLDRATLLQPDSSFVESVLLGANVELLTEFLWREFPTDRRGTPIARFWPHPDGSVDVPPIHQWNGELGSNCTVDDVNTTFLFIRADLFNRYPDTVILAAPAEVDPAHPNQLRLRGTQDDWKKPNYTIRIDASTRAIAFPIAPHEVQTPASALTPGWFFVLLQPHTSLHFGFDLRSDPPVAQPSGLQPPVDWNAMTWDHVLDARGFASARRSVTFENAVPAQWGGDSACSADVARIALQRPALVAMHASTMVPTHG